MRLAELRVRNYRCLDAFDLRLDPLTAIIGANGTGKSSVIRALEFLFGLAAGTQADVTSGSDDLEFEVDAVLDGLDDDQRQAFAPWTEDDGTLAVGRRWTADRDETGAVTGTSTSWFASRQAVVAFTAVRTAASAAEAKDRYSAVRADPRYEDLPPYKNRPEPNKASTTGRAPTRRPTANPSRTARSASTAPDPSTTSAATSTFSSSPPSAIPPWTPTRPRGATSPGSSTSSCAAA